MDIKGPNLVKGIHLEGLRVLGKPSDFAHFYYNEGVDELLYMDVVASLYERNSLDMIIEETAKDIFIPLTVGGGIRTIDDIKKVLRAGADKVCINTAAIRNPRFLQEATTKFGSSTIVVAIEAIKQPDGKYLAFIDNGRQHTGVEAVSWAQKVEDLGCGEIIITSVDREGTGNGFDIDLTRMITDAVNIPVIVHGGAGNSEHILEIFKDSDADAACISSMFHYDYVESDHYSLKENTEGNYDFIKSKKGVKHIVPTSIKNLKEFLSSRQVSLRST